MLVEQGLAHKRLASNDEAIAQWPPYWVVAATTSKELISSTGADHKRSGSQIEMKESDSLGKGALIEPLVRAS
jgi:hypothetical protein